MSQKYLPLELDDEQLRKLQLEMLQLLIEFDRICRKHQIQYFLSSGTLLGAVRHKGFIPWDDDADVEMLRPDYEKFCSVCVEELDAARFRLVNHRTDVNYRWPFSKLQLKNTKFIRRGYEHMKQESGINIDIFPLDHMCEHALGRHFIELSTKVCRKILWSPVGARNVEGFWQRQLFKLLSIAPKEWTLRLFEYLSTLYNEADTSKIAFHTYEGRTERGYGFNKQWYCDTIEVEFEGHTFLAPRGYGDILTFWYDDYMKIPEPEERESHGNASYIEFSDGTRFESGIK